VRWIDELQRLNAR